MTSKHKRIMFVWSTSILPAVLVFYIAKPFLAAEWRIGLVAFCVSLWSWFFAKPVARKVWPDVKKGWAE